LPNNVPLFCVPFWVQVHNLPIGFMSNAVGESIEKSLGKFCEYDTKNSSNVWKLLIQIRILIDVRFFASKGKENQESWRNFCYLCGLIGHTNELCEKILSITEDEG
ncbi:hypothetical protein glysoja_008983, partial [Glycine soja]